jgi:GT2 family glycosyltransferase
MAVDPPLSIDVVIPTYDGWAHTESCLRHLREQSVAHRVIVSDNGSTDATPQRIREGFPEVRLVEGTGNPGFPHACNAGAAAGDGDVIVLLNNDVDARPDFLERIVAPLAADASVGSVTATMLMPDGETIDNVGLAADVTLAGWARLRGRPAADAGGAVPRLLGPCGGAGAYRRAAWEQVGGLDEGVRFYSEDLDLALRLRAARWDAGLAADAVGVHLGGATMGNRSALQREAAGFARAYFLRRYGVVRSRVAPRALATEVLVAAADAARHRDLAAVRGRVRGARAARRLPPAPAPPPDALEPGIGFIEGLRLRRAGA